MSVLLFASVLLGSVGPEGSGIVWIRDDWPSAEARARATGRRVAVDVWATWCHTCSSMDAYVLKSEVLVPVRDAHVYLALDFDLPANRAFFERYPVDVFPTFLVLDPRTGEVVARRAGSAGAEEMRAFFDDARAEIDTAGAALARRDFEVAERGFAARALAAADRTARAEALLGWIEAVRAKDPRRCALEGWERAKGVELGIPAGVEYAALLVACAARTDPSDRSELMARIRDWIGPALTGASEDLTPDDRSTLFGVQIEALDALGDAAGSRVLTRRRLELLEEAASAAPTPESRATFEGHRLDAYLRLGRADDAVAMLERSTRERPGDFNAWWRLAVASSHAGRAKEAVNAIERALELGYGGRLLRLHASRLEILLRAGRNEDARKAAVPAREALESWRSQSVPESWRRELSAQLAAVDRAS